MFQLEELIHFITYVEEGTLSKAAEKLHISQPTLTRSMQHLEEEFQVPIFTRTKNKIQLTRTGEYTATLVRNYLNETNQLIQNVQVYEEKQHTIHIVSCAPAPLWELPNTLNELYPNQKVTFSILNEEECYQSLKDQADIAITIHPIHDDKYICIPYVKESLSICVDASSPLAKKESISFEEIDGYHFLLSPRIGFWDELQKRKMPNSHFLVQKDRKSLDELKKNSTIPYFITNLSQRHFNETSNRIHIPISDSEATVTFYLIYEKDKLNLLTNKLKRG